MWKEIVKIIESYDSFLLTTHINPDGDAIGSEVALKGFLEDIGKNVVIVNSSETPENLLFLDPGREIRVFKRGTEKELFEAIEVVFILDVNNWEHLGIFGKALRRDTHPRVCIDHHEGEIEDFADVNVNDTSFAATGVMIYDLIAAVNGTLTRDVAEAIYAAIITDTGTFRFSNTDSRTFRVAADLCDRGLDPYVLYRQVFANKTWGTGRLLGPVLSSVQSAADGRLAWIVATKDMYDEAGAVYDDSDGFIDLVRAIKGVELVLFFKEISRGKIKVSLRSNGRADAFAIARAFGGGGHRMAAGMQVDGPMNEAIDTVVSTCLQVEQIKSPPD